MIQTITVENQLAESVTFILRSPEQSGFFIKSVDGLGPVKATINMSEALSLDGSSFNSARLNGRNVVFKLGFLDNPTIEDSRQKSYQMFPLKSLVKITIVTDNKTVKTEGYIESNEPDIFSNDEGNQVSIICADAYLRSLITTFISFSTVTSLFQFPFSNESLVAKLIVFGEILLTPQQSITYTGEAPTGFIMHIHATGPVHNITIFNLITREFFSINSDTLIEMMGQDIIAGDDIIISSVVGSKYVYLKRDGETYNILNTVSSDSSWFELVRGNNSFYYLTDSGQQNLHFSIEYVALYEGI